MTQTIGFIGLGSMGLPMTRVLAEAGYVMLGYDTSENARGAAAKIAGVEIADDASQVAAQADIMFSCVPNDAVLLKLYLGENGLQNAFRGDQITIDCSTVGPKTTREISAALKIKNVVHLDASMLGSVPQAETGQIGFVVGGEQEAFEKALSPLDVLGKMVKHVGGSGSANQVKLIHQTLVAINAVAVAEALTLCMATDTDIDAFYDVVCNGGGMAYSRYFENRTPRMRDGDFSALFTLDFMSKDAGLAHVLADQCELETPMLNKVLETLRAAQKAGYGGEDFSAVARVYEDALGRRLSDS